MQWCGKGSIILIGNFLAADDEDSDEFDLIDIDDRVVGDWQ